MSRRISSTISQLAAPPEAGGTSVAGCLASGRSFSARSTSTGPSCAFAPSLFRAFGSSSSSSSSMIPGVFGANEMPRGASGAAGPEVDRVPDVDVRGRLVGAGAGAETTLPFAPSSGGPADLTALCAGGSLLRTGSSCLVFAGGRGGTGGTSALPAFLASPSTAWRRVEADEPVDRREGLDWRD